MRKGENMLSVGDRAPDFALDTVEGGVLPFGDVLSKGKQALLIFLRYLG
jgi:peroxiredoxin